jgi:hypothetical protein
MSEYREATDVSGWAVGGVIFAGVILIVIGVFHFLAGLAGIIEDQFYVIAPNYVYDLDASAWGWIHLLIGIVLAATGLGLLARQSWAGIVGIMLAALSAIVNFFFIPYYPFWSLLIIALDVWVIWALTRPGAVRTT